MSKTFRANPSSDKYNLKKRVNDIEATPAAATELADDSVSGDKIKDASITTAHLDSNFVGNGIEVVGNKLTVKLDASSGLVIGSGGLSLDSLFLPTLSSWSSMNLKSGWFTVASGFGYKAEYRFIQYGTQRQYFLRGQVKKSSGPSDWEAICVLAGASGVMLPPQNQYFIVSVNDIDSNPYDFNQWTISLRGSHNGIASDSPFLLFAGHNDADRSEEIHEGQNWFSLDAISWWVDTLYYPSGSDATSLSRPPSRYG
jgi:hypothetical protein